MREDAFIKRVKDRVSGKIAQLFIDNHIKSVILAGGGLLREFSDLDFYPTTEHLQVFDAPSAGSQDLLCAVCGGVRPHLSRKALEEAAITALGSVRYQGGRIFHPLQVKAPARRLRLHGYGDAIVAQAAAEFIRSFVEAHLE